MKNMKKMALIMLLVTMVVVNCACLSNDLDGFIDLPDLSYTETCRYYCGLCDKCMDTSCTNSMCAEKCQGHTEEIKVFSDGDFITTEPISIDTGSAVIDIGANVYVRGDLAQRVEEIIAAIEKVSGLDFDGNGYGRDLYTDGKIHITANRDELYINEDWYQGSIYSEVGRAYGGRSSHAYVSPSDLLICGGYVIVHELSHVLMYRQQGWYHSQLMNEGFAEYTTYLALKELQTADPSYQVSLGPSTYPIYNMWMETEKMYEQPLTYWFDNTFEYSGNANYTIGFRFMAYLDDVYGNYAAWVPAFYQMDRYDEQTAIYDSSTTDQQLAVLRATYGRDVLTHFYSWLRDHESQFDLGYDYRIEINLCGVDAIHWYPTFDAVESSVILENLDYRDLYINLESARNYLAAYKNCDITNLVLRSNDPVMVNLYRSDGSYTTAILKNENDSASLEGVSYIKLVGEGSTSCLRVEGFTLPRQLVLG